MEREKNERNKYQIESYIIPLAIGLLFLAVAGINFKHFNLSNDHLYIDIAFFSIAGGFLIYLSIKLLRTNRTLSEKLNKLQEAEADLKETNKLLDEYFNYAIDLFCIADNEGNFLKLNRQWESAIGYSTDEMYRIKFFELIHPDDIPATNEIVAKLNRGEEINNFVNRYRTKEGQYKYIEWRSVMSGNKIIAAARDITGRKENERLLLARDELLNKLSQQLPGFLYQYKMYPDNRTCFPFASENIQEIYGVKPEDVKYDASIILERLHADDRDRVIKKIRESYETLSLWEDEYRVAIPGKDIFWVYGIARPLLQDDGSVLWHGYISDITRRKEIELELKRIKEQYELAVNGSNDGIWDWNMVTNELFLSRRWKEMLGYEDNELPNEYSTFDSLLYEGDKGRVSDYVSNYLEGKIDKYSIDFRMKHKSGAVKWILAKGEAIRDTEGRPVRMAGSHSDITERKKNEGDLRISEEKFSKVFYLNPSAAGLTDVNNDCYVEVNQAFLDTFELERENAIGKNPFELGILTIEEGERLIKIASQKKRILNEEAVLYSKSGKPKYVLLSSEQIKIGNNIYRYTVVNDITERKMAELALIESESHFKAIFSIVPIPIILINPSSQRVRDINEAGAKMIGLNASDIIGKACYEFICPIEEGVCPNFGAGEKSTDYEKKLITASGEERDIIKYVIPIKYKGEDCCLESIVDITDQKRKAEELLEANARLQNAKEDLELSNNEKDKMYSIVAHDLKSPFQGFIGLTELLAEGAEKLPLSELKQLSREMHLSAKNLYKLLGNLLSWAMLQQGKFDFNPKPLLLGTLVNENIAFLAERGKQKGIKIEKKIADNIVVYADEEMLNTILRNLLANAVKFTQREGKVIIEALRIDDGLIEISIKDNGIGIPERLIERLFTEGEKTGRIGTGGEKSTGLGLLLCKEYVAMHNSSITVESKEGAGSVFKFTLQGGINSGFTE